MNTNAIPVAADYIKDFEQLGFGMFVHFGLYSGLKRGEWAYNIHKMDMKTYAPMMHDFKVGSMSQIVDVAKSAGCKYVCLTTRHHEGFSLYDTKGLCDFDVMHSPTARDLVAEFVEECRKADIVPFFYHTTLDWYQPDFNENFDKYLDYLYESVKILCTNYGKVGGFWFDGNWSKKEADWKEDRLYKMIRHYQPTAMIINNTGLNQQGKLGAEEIDSVTFERGMPRPMDRRGHKKYVAGEMCQTLCDHWGASDDLNFKPVKQLIEELCECRKVGSNFLLNIGPNFDGSVPKMQQAIMECIGRWMQSYGKAIYNGRPYIQYDDCREFWLQDVKDPNTAYLFRFNPGTISGDANVTLSFSENDAITLPDIDRKIASIEWMDNGQPLPFEQDGKTLHINVPGYPYGQNLCVRVAEVKFQ